MTAPALALAPAPALAPTPALAPAPTPAHPLPQWWLDLQAAAWRRHTTLPMPAPTDERWRFTTLPANEIADFGLRISDWQTARITTGATPPLASGNPQSAIRNPQFKPTASLAFTDNHLTHRTPLPATLAAQGVIFCPLGEAIINHPGLIRAYHQKHEVALGGEKFTTLNTALTTSGALLYVPKNITIDAPFHLEHTATPGASIYPHTLVILEDNARATLIEHFTSPSDTGDPPMGSSDTGDSPVGSSDTSDSPMQTAPRATPPENAKKNPSAPRLAPASQPPLASEIRNPQSAIRNPQSRPQPPPLACGVNDLHAAPGARLTYIGAQTCSPGALCFQTNSIVAQRDARILSLNLHLGGRYARHESHARLQGPGAHSEMLALTIATGAQQFDQRTLQTHQAPRTTSNLLYKNALLDTAKTIFSGLIVVEPDAQKTDAYQSNRNLMLSDDAEANSLPGLEIQANDVRCTHGATTARVPAEQEFYLQSRGIPPAAAHELLVAGFFEEVLAKLEDKNLQATLRALLQAKFQKKSV